MSTRNARPGRCRSASLGLRGSQPRCTASHRTPNRGRRAARAGKTNLAGALGTGDDLKPSLSSNYPWELQEVPIWEASALDQTGYILKVKLALLPRST
ncbi:hypothetical protein FIBSPDRAFT_872912 [Athelia psychrophila]|uniref:Uncharacterized protein n=1 Tax=Athelia psychrophila TaxID=1759441 RepID=A0A165Z2N4_9AGAM|nr:hypothetical protein FIBSPDRAFT_872912 [Fibularhizoctonia sp. CBS 109695]